MLKGHEYHFIAWKPLTVGTECDIVFLGILNTCIGRSPKTKHIFWAQQFMGISLITTHCIYIWEIGALIFLWGLLRWLSGKESTCQWRRWGFDPWVGKIPWKRIWQPTPVSCLDSPMDRGDWQAAVHGVTKSRTWLSSWAHTAHLMNKIRCFFLPFLS